jgi:hypothetical protein
MQEGKLKDIIAVATSTVNISTSQHLEFVDFYVFSDCSFLLGQKFVFIAVCLIGFAAYSRAGGSSWNSTLRIG